jgi:hypothetical protein
MMSVLGVKLPVTVEERVWLGLPEKDGEAVEDELRDSEIVTQPLPEKVLVTLAAPAAVEDCD